MPVVSSGFNEMSGIFMGILGLSVLCAPLFVRRSSQCDWFSRGAGALHAKGHERPLSWRSRGVLESGLPPEAECRSTPKRSKNIMAFCRFARVIYIKPRRSCVTAVISFNARCGWREFMSIDAFHA